MKLSNFAAYKAKAMSCCRTLVCHTKGFESESRLPPYGRLIVQQRERGGEEKQGSGFMLIILLVFALHRPHTLKYHLRAVNH